MFIPGRKVFICANTKQQAAQITKEKLYEIYDHWPLLKKEVLGNELKEYPGNFGKDYVTLKFRNGSQLDVVLAGDAARGGRRHGYNLKKIFLPLLVFSIGYTYTQVANYLGVKPATVKDWFNGRSRKKNKELYLLLTEEEKSQLYGRVKTAELSGNPKSESSN